MVAMMRKDASAFSFLFLCASSCMKETLHCLAWLALPPAFIGPSGQLSGSLNQRREQIRLKVGNLPLQHSRIRSSPAPVSIDGLGNGVSVYPVVLPEASVTAERSNCMKTDSKSPHTALRLAQTAYQLPQSPPPPSPCRKKSPSTARKARLAICQKLSLSPYSWMRSLGTPASIQ